jgi:hypothetical protein
MRLPDGVFHRPRQELLIEKDKWAIIRIETRHRKHLLNSRYVITSRSYNEVIAPYLKGDWDEFERLFGLNPKRIVHIQGEPSGLDVVYSFAKYHIEPTKHGFLYKLPNITVVPNLSTINSEGLLSPWIVFGCTMGHYHPPSLEKGSYIQEVYEFQSYGLLVLDRGLGAVELWVAQDGDKVAIPSDCHMTLYNLGDKDQPLVTLDIADYDHQPSRDVVRQCGPILLAYFNDFEVIFKLNWLYINNATHRVGVRLDHLPDDDEARKIRISRGARLELGRLLYEQLTQNPVVIGKFARLGISVRQASPEAVLEPLHTGQGSRLHFCRPLVEAVKKGTEVYKYFFPQSVEIELPLPRSVRSETRKSRDDSRKGDQEPGLDLKPLNRNLVVVVEGSGDWVEQAYRVLFKEKLAGKRLSVFYADDSRWKRSPQWADPERWTNPEKWESPSTTGLQPWEVYLDKADPNDFARYINLRPDVVFVVTPDFTHCAIADQWLGKAAIVFLEKPFDSQSKNVETLLLSLGQRQKSEAYTEVMGLDHYQFYALPIAELWPNIIRHLGGAIANVDFFLTEVRPIENGRARSLQYGLTLDLLPHLIALLIYFGDISTIDDIVVVEAAQYYPLVAVNREGTEQESISYASETYSQVKFTFQDRSAQDFRIPCQAVVGKGVSQEVKYLEVAGHNGNAIRVDLNRRDEATSKVYPWDSVFFIQGEGKQVFSEARIRVVKDPYSSRQLRILENPAKPESLCRALERNRYLSLIQELLKARGDTLASAITRAQGREIVDALDRIWWALQDSKPWKKYNLGQLNPTKPDDSVWHS